MMSIKETAAQFFDSCETGQGWEVCKRFCHPDASFSAQADAFQGIQTLDAYTESMKRLLSGPIPDGSYELRPFAVDEERGNVCGYGGFKGSNTGEGGPVAPTGNIVETDHVYVMEFEGDRIRHMTKIWNDGFAMRQLARGIVEWVLVRPVRNRLAGSPGRLMRLRHRYSSSPDA